MTTTAHQLPDGEVRIYDPNPEEGDLGRMYVLDVLGVEVLIHERDGEVYVHLDTVAPDSTRPGAKPVAYEVNNTGDNLIGEPLPFAVNDRVEIVDGDHVFGAGTVHSIRCSDDGESIYMVAADRTPRARHGYPANALRAI